MSWMSLPHVAAVLLPCQTLLRHHCHQLTTNYSRGAGRGNGISALCTQRERERERERSCMRGALLWLVIAIVAIICSSLFNQRTDVLSVTLNSRRPPPAENTTFAMARFVAESFAFSKARAEPKRQAVARGAWNNAMSLMKGRSSPGVAMLKAGVYRWVVGLNNWDTRDATESLAGPYGCFEKDLAGEPSRPLVVPDAHNFFRD